MVGKLGRRAKPLSTAFQRLPGAAPDSLARSGPAIRKPSVGGTVRGAGEGTSGGIPT